MTDTSTPPRPVAPAAGPARPAIVPPAAVATRPPTDALPGRRPAAPPTSPLGAMAAAVLDRGAPRIVDVLLGVAVARTLPPADVGRFAAAVLAVGLARVAGRVLVPVVDRGAGDAAGGIPLRTPSTSPSVLVMARLRLVALPLSALLGVVSLAAPGVSRQVLVLLAVIVPPLVAVDALRDAARRAPAAAVRPPGLAIRIGATWTMGTGLVVAAGAAAGTTTPDDAVLAVGAAAVLAVGVGLASWPEPASDRPPTRSVEDDDRSLDAGLSPGALLGGLVAPVVTLGVLVAGGMEAGAGLWGAVLLLVPVVVLVDGVRAAVEVGPTPRAGAGWTGAVVRSAVAMAAVVTLWSAADSIGPALLGATWPHARPALVPVGVIVVLAALLPVARSRLAPARAIVRRS